ncbi:MAG TPA: hypothetical protein VJO72_13940, partial [Candidatus Dormibacteraeota bacterium]|nr:hypothetical protein [Candidatus Dormibacteraeota bacterium]
AVPESPTHSSEALEAIELIPCGSTQYHITESPAWRSDPSEARNGAQNDFGGELRKCESTRKRETDGKGNQACCVRSS